MSGAALVSRGQGSYALEGVLDFDSVASLVAKGGQTLTGPGRLDLDLGAVREANSAGLALLLEWLESARRRRLQLRVHNLPDSLKSLAMLANVDSLLPVTERSGPKGTEDGP
jgi:phospholipid transport system transporter-binding protein